MKELLSELVDRVNHNNKRFDFESIVKAMKEDISTLHEAIRQVRTNEIFEEVTQKLELFAGLSGFKDKKVIESQVSALSAYLLFNQLLFYHIYIIKNPVARTWSKLEPIESVNDLMEYFNRITHEDYTPIYAIDIVKKLPNIKEVIDPINDTIKSLRLLKIENVTQDIAGRFFHAMLPEDVAKVWAAFYTNVNAADVLSKFSIRHWNESVVDPSCGSGTLLCAVYRRKLELYKELNGYIDADILGKLHKEFLEEEITGIDIMPFAAYLTTVNLAMQHVEQPTDIVRIARRDSILDFNSHSLKTKDFKENGMTIPEFSEQANATLFGEKSILNKTNTVAPSGIGKPFILKPVDLVIMNPPFSDRTKLPPEYLKKLKKSTFRDVCGNEINLWGYFLALADLLLKPEGRIATVIPINIARGGATQKIRNFIINNYHLEFIVESEADIAFSESSTFRDILLIAKKTNPANYTKIALNFTGCLFR